MAETAEKAGTPRPLYTYRAAITKGEAIRYISHLDYADMMQRAICRAKLPAAYSEGFNPHLKIAFASALAVGVTSEAEYMDFELTQAIPPEEVGSRLRQELPAGVELRRLRLLTGRPKALMAQVDQADYEITLPCADEVGAKKAVQAFNEATECLYRRSTPKKSRDIEVKQYVKGDVALSWEAGTARLAVAICITPTGSIKPGEILSVLTRQFAFPGESALASLHRRALRHDGQSLIDLD